MKKIFTLFAALAMVMSMSAATKTIYCKMAQSWWKADGAAVGAYAWNDGGDTNANYPGVRMTKVEGEADLWSIDIDASKYNKIIFTRVNGSGTIADWGAKTANQNIPTDDKNLFTITSSSPVWGDPGCTGTWSTYAPDAPKTYKDITITVTANAAASIKWSDAGDKLANATAYVAMTAGENNTYSYTLKQVDEASGVNFTIKVGDIESALKNTNTNFTADFKELMKKVVVKGVKSWDDIDIMTISDDYLTASITLSLAANKAYDLKLTVNGEWFGGNTIAITKDNNSAKFDTNGDGNGKLTTDLAGDYVFTYTYATKTLVVTYPEPEPEYDVKDITMTNLVVQEMEDFVVLTASDDSNTGLNVMLAVNEDGSLAADSYMAMVQGWNEVELPIVEGTITKTYSEELATDVYSGLVVVEYNEGYLGLDLTMYYVAPEYTDIVITNATVTEDIRDLGWGDETYTVLLLESTWSDGVETYPVLVEVNDYDLSVVEGTAVVSVTIGGQGDEDPWLGNVPDGEMKYTIADGVITLQGKLENASAWPAPVYWNLTISGKLPQGPATALDNIAVEAKAIKMIKNGQLIIIKNGVQYNVQGAVIK